ncbi:class I adenylate-forming enzyme family protein [Bradyrhizobium sp. CCBAU 11445]|uniref:class I adenylate-forming enzyme family protein n=1 Tax=Bradyrhizobium sp. CCBAU 11445 TaxID=1630896 RepID=UPI002306D990|nr:class I adenylate-forming enzyme family protein [Bradyrhizobium sp. CCBAU 11445]
MANALRKIEALEAAYQTTTVGQLVSMRARTHGSTTAIDVFERGERATYLEMEQWSNKYARALQAFGVRKGDRVGVMLPNRIEFPIFWFALAKLGAVLVSVNMRYTHREIEYVLSETQAKFAIVDELVWPVFSAMEPWPRDLAQERVIVVGQSSDKSTFHKLVTEADASPLNEEVGPDDLANIAYTSGTTGFPKGCMLTHDYWGVTSYAHAYTDLQPYKAYLCVGPFTYAESPSLLLKSYRQGGTLYLAPQLSSTRFVDWLKKYRIEWCGFPELIARQTEADRVFTDLRQVGHFGGWNPEAVRRFRKQFAVHGQAGYGMNEIGYGTQMPAEIEEMEESGSNGIRSPFRQLQLVNDDGSPTPAGEVGELWVKGRAIFKGYWNNPEATAAVFEGEWFKTGDLFRRDELGFHWLVGRKKEVIRRSSENIAAREVEAIIREIPQIADVAAVPVPDAKRGEEVKIYVELTHDVTRSDLLVEHILEHARARLAAFKVPRYIAFAESLPRTTSTNKVLKRELTNIKDPLAGTYDAEEKRWR